MLRLPQHQRINFDEMFIFDQLTKWFVRGSYEYIVRWDELIGNVLLNDNRTRAARDGCEHHWITTKTMKC